MASFRTGKFDKEAIKRDWQSKAHVKHYADTILYLCRNTARRRSTGRWGKRLDIQGVMSPDRSGVSRGICDAGSYTHAADDAAEIQRVAYDRISEGEVGDPDIQRVSASETKLHSAALLGARVLRKYGWVR